MVVFNKCEEEFDWLLADDDEGKAFVLGLMFFKQGSGGSHCKGSAKD